MPPTDDDQSAERESRINEMIKGYRREQLPASSKPPENSTRQTATRRNGRRRVKSRKD